MPEALPGPQASALLAQLLLEQRALRDAVDALRDEQQFLARRLLAADDRRGLARLLPLVHALMADRAWTAAELFAVSLNARGAGELQDLLGEWRTDSGGLRAFGRFLERTSGGVSAGLRLVSAGERNAEEGTYLVRRVSRAPKPAPAVDGPPALAHDDPIARRSSK